MPRPKREIADHNTARRQPERPVTNRQRLELWEQRTGREANQLRRAPQAPDVALHIVDVLFDVGPALPAGGGLRAVTYSDIADWQRVVGRPLGLWEARTIRSLSRVYLSEYERGMDGEGPPRLTQDMDREQRRNLAAGLKQLFGAQARRNQRKARKSGPSSPPSAN